MFRFLVLVLVAVTSTKAQNLVVVGGSLADDNADIYGKVIDLAGGPGVAKIGVVTAASSTPVENGIFYEEMFLSYGALSATWIPIDETRIENNEDPEVVAMILEQTGFFFGGGDQERIITSFYNEPGRVESSALAAIREVYLSGGVVGGTSAGASCMSTNVMVTGGLSYDGLLYGAYPGGFDPDYPDDLCYDEFGGIGLISGMIVDTHYSERGREGRIIRLVSDTMQEPLGTTMGVGVDENTALVVYNVGEIAQYGEVIGENGVLFLELAGSVEIPGEYFQIENVMATYLTKGDEVTFSDGVINSFTPASWKPSLWGDEYYENAITSDDIFCHPDKPVRNSREFAEVSRRLFDNQNDLTTTGDSWMGGPTFRVYMEKNIGEGANGYGGYDANGDFIVSYRNMNVDINSV